MKLTFVTLATVAALSLGSKFCSTAVVTLEAQSFPVTIRAQVNPPNALDEVTAATFQLDAATPVSQAPTVQPSCSCIEQTFVINDSNNHTITARFVNQWGTSSPTAKTFRVKVPDSPTGMNVKP